MVKREKKPHHRAIRCNGTLHLDHRQPVRIASTPEPAAPRKRLLRGRTMYSLEQRFIVNVFPSQSSLRSRRNHDHYKLQPHANRKRGGNRAAIISIIESHYHRQPTRRRLPPLSDLLIYNAKMPNAPRLRVWFTPFLSNVRIARREYTMRHFPLHPVFPSSFRSLSRLTS